MTIRKWGLALAGAALLSGCASPLTGKSADLAARQVLAQNWQHASYNVEGEVGFDEIRIGKPGAASPLPPQYAGTLDQLTHSISGRFTGAIDKSSGRIEMIPELRLERRNLLISVKLPLLINLADLSLLVDPAAADLIFPELRQHPGKYLRLRVPPEQAARFPLKALDQAMPRLIDESYAQVDKKAFSFQPLDAYAAEVGARYRLRTTLNRLQESRLSLALLDGMLKVAQQQAPRQPNQTGLDAETLLQVIKAAAISTTGQLSGLTVSDLYLDRAGRILAIRQQMTLNGQGMRVRGHARFRYSHFDQPVFTLQPAESDIIDAGRLKSLDFLNQLDKAPAASAAQ